MKHAISCNVVVVVLLLVATATGRNIEERSISGASGGAFNMVGRYCDSRSICGWEIYGDLRRHIYYLRNQCECPPTTRCVRVEDDVLQEAYIYRCRRIISSPYV
ncbi:uncharacterized protein LOC123518882 [Portunus trituberculatus]|uniref:uncharacterized protein LOC123518882 n=1 Tax=Portunus trituberculatus TaxID=210409 RepID=UPI001E1CFB28|nr:uncharacterized protein LOC123518882 [Portunus trituberculatus]